MNTNTHSKTNLLKFCKTLSKVIEIICWVGVACLLAISIFSLVDTPWAQLNLMSGSGLSMNGVDIVFTGDDANASLGAAIIILISGAFGFVLLALLFRNMHSVLATAETGSPFQSENVKRIEKIGYLSIALPMVGFFASVLAKLFGGPDNLEISIDLTGVVMGLLVLCLSQFFSYGVKLENDVDGLV